VDIRQIQKEDYDLVYEFVKVAFKTANVSQGDEQDYVLKWRAGENYISELEFIAEENCEIIGHIMLQKLKIQTIQGEYIGLMVAPLSVKLEQRKRGVGKKLVYRGFERAKELGYTAAFLAGDSKYYSRFGFKEIGEFGIENKTEIPNQFVLGCEIVNGALKNVKGVIDNLI
jgi:putative acetyltransferase